jgi:hypothetical protein
MRRTINDLTWNDKNRKENASDLSGLLGGSTSKVAARAILRDDGNS